MSNQLVNSFVDGKCLFFFLLRIMGMFSKRLQITFFTFVHDDPNTVDLTTTLTCIYIKGGERVSTVCYLWYVQLQKANVKIVIYITYLKSKMYTFCFGMLIKYVGSRSLNIRAYVTFL